MSLKIRQRRRLSGFTLIELLVVVFLIGLISGFAVLSVNSRGNNRDIEEQIKRLQIQLGLAGEESVVQVRPIGVQFTQGQYLFLIAGKYKWLQLENNKALQTQELQPGWKFELRLGNKNVPLAQRLVDSSQIELLPQIIFLPSGEITPFELLIVDSGNTPKYRIWYGEDGVIAMEVLEAG